MEQHLGQFIINHWQLWLALIVVLLIIFINELSIQRTQAKELTPQTAIDLINNENALVIDLRDQEAFKQGHIINSLNFKSEDFAHQKIEKFKNKPLILICNKNSEAQSIIKKLNTQGYQPRILTGGITAWQNADLPLVKGK